MKFLFLVVTLFWSSVQGQGEQVRLLGSVSVVFPGFTNLFIDENFDTPAERNHIIFSSFDSSPVGDDFTFGLYQVGTALDNLEEVEVDLLAQDILWPREPMQIPNDVFGFPAVSQPSGFLVPLKNQGDLSVVNVTDWFNPVTYQIARPEGDTVGWFYHRVIWKDMDGDGDMDALTSRTEVDLSSGGFTSQLVWFTRPNTPEIFAEVWDANVIPQGNDIADTFHVPARLSVPSGEEFDVVFTTGYWSEKLTVFWTTNPDGLWDNNTEIQSREVDIGGGRGKFYSIYYTDVNFDGRFDLLISINDPEDGSVWAYEIPDDFRTDEYPSHQLASGFIPTSGADNSGAPGAAITFHPIAANEGVEKPFIVVSSDDQGSAFVFEPVDRLDPDNWEYTNITLLDEGPGKIVGQPTPVDIDGDGFAEIFVPSYTNNLIYVFSYSPEE